MLGDIVIKVETAVHEGLFLYLVIIPESYNKKKKLYRSTAFSYATKKSKTNLNVLQSFY